MAANSSFYHQVQGQAELSPGRLVLKEMFPGSRQGYTAEESCTYAF